MWVSALTNNGEARLSVYRLLMREDTEGPDRGREYNQNQARPFGVFNDYHVLVFCLCCAPTEFSTIVHSGAFG